MKKTQDTHPGLSMSFLGLIFVVVAASGGAAYAIFKKPDHTPKRAASAAKADSRASWANSDQANRGRRTDPGKNAAKDEVSQTSEAFTRLAHTLAQHSANADEGDDDELDGETWKPAPWKKPAGGQEQLTRDTWTPKSVAALEPETLLDSIRAERNLGARRKLVSELLSRDISSPQMVQATRNNPAAIVDVISTEPDAVSRAKLAEQIGAVDMPPEVKEDTAVELLLIPDGSVKVTAMEMLLSEPDNALRRLEYREEREDDPEKLEVIRGAIKYFQRKERER